MFPAGKYYVGDLCYVIKDWEAFCDMTLTAHDVLNGEFPWKTGKLWTHTTAWGDGGYFDEEGREYGVDAGLIGVLPYEFVDRDDGSADGGQIIEFKQPFDPYYSDGKFHIGHIVIDTDPEYEEDDYEEEEDEEDDE